jgi:putative heme degradation protein
MSVESHPLFQAWNEALEHLVEAERRFYSALMEERSPDEIQHAALDLDEARSKYRKIADAIG